MRPPGGWSEKFSKLFLSLCLLWILLKLVFIPSQCEVTRGVARRFCPTRAHSKQLSARRGGQGLIYVDDDDIGDDDDDDDVNDFVDGDMPSP